MDTPTLFFTDVAFFVDWVTQYVHDTAQSFLTDWNTNRFASIAYCQAAFQTISRTHGNGSNYAVTKLLLYFKG